ncbi:unnamed protein product [Paramecium primaurelia]|uniref:Uncharacterized protein n=1 Tax=Paramecium primaurelia TaxID=5886 RepID=A0A8S1N6N2_PARPR|nr:unnamed protein product [Paramecium primaurelia]
MDLKSKSSNIASIQEDGEQSYKANEFSDSQSQDQYQLKNIMHKKIKKYQQKRKSCNWGSGRPSKQNNTVSNNQQNQLQLTDDLSKFWFGTDISMQLIIYLCKVGNMIPKVVTGIPAAKKKKDFIKYDKDKETLQNHSIETHLNIKKYSNQLKKELKIKHSKLLEYLQYSEDTTYMFLEENNICQDQLHLYKYISQENKIGLEVVLKYLSPKFILTYKFIIQEYYQKNVNIDILIDTILKKLIDDQQNHKMIFDRQLIYELTKDDINLINEIESNPHKAEFHLYQNSRIRNLNFFSNTFNDEVEEITRKSLWIRQFVQGFIEILQNCDINTQIEQKNIK